MLAFVSFNTANSIFRNNMNGSPNNANYFYY